MASLKSEMAEFNVSLLLMRATSIVIVGRLGIEADRFIEIGDSLVVLGGPEEVQPAARGVSVRGGRIAADHFTIV